MTSKNKIIRTVLLCVLGFALSLTTAITPAMIIDAMKVHGAAMAAVDCPTLIIGITSAIVFFIWTIAATDKL